MAAVHCLCRAIEGAYGPLTVQLFKTRSGELEFIEVNPRFGGGYPLTMHAGADFAEYLLRDLRGDELEYDSGWADGTLMLRYDAEVIVRDRGI
jgi:carbamoyl-phosphate synthase large subunit